MSYSKAQIANLCTLVTSGGTPLTSVPAYYDPKEVPWLKTGEVNYCRIYDTESYISKEGLARSSAKMIPANSVVVAMYGQGDTAGRVAINKIPLSTNQACCNLVINHVIADYEYVYYALCTLYDRLVALKNGGAQPNLNAKKIKAIEIPFPDLETQRTIASVLGAYDNLIENNQKQIKLLEEATQRLYKEWFVDLRFPGYEDTPIVDGVPEGWKKCLLGDINCSLESGSRPKGGIDASLVDGVPSIGAENVIGLGCYNYSSEKLITKDFFSKMKRGKLCDKDILIYKDGAYIGRTSLFQDGFPHLEAAVNEHVFLLHAADEHIQYYLFFTLYQQEYYQKMQKLNKNAAQPGINSKAMMSLPVLLPTEDILDGFDSFATPLMHKIFNLAKQNRRLELARDRLLPKLMSGEIEV